MAKLLGVTGGGRMLAIGMAAEVAGFPLEFVDLQMGKDNETAEYCRNIHPLGRIPALDLGADGYIFESKACMRYVLRKGVEKGNKHLYGCNAVEASKVDQWIDFTAGELEPVAFGMFYNGMFGPKMTEDEFQAKVDQTHCVLAGLEQWLETRTFLVGERLSGADIAVVSALEYILGKTERSSEFWKHKNVVRYYMTVFHSHPGFAVASKKNKGTGFAVEKPAAAPKAAPAPAAKKEEAKPAANDDDDDQLAIPEPKKKQNPLDDLAPSKLVLDAWKREYSNAKSMAAAAKWLWENYDAEGYTMWFGKYKYNDELKKVFMTSNLTRGWFQRMEGIRKYVFGVALILGTETDHEISSFWIVRGKSDTLPACMLDVEDVTLFDWRVADIKADKELIENFLAWEGPKLEKPYLEGRTFK